jgi:hypothetical protein
MWIDLPRRAATGELTGIYIIDWELVASDLLAPRSLIAVTYYRQIKIRAEKRGEYRRALRITSSNQITSRKRKRKS